ESLICCDPIVEVFAAGRIASSSSSSSSLGALFPLYAKDTCYDSHRFDDLIVNTIPVGERDDRIQRTVSENWQDDHV
ncbi:4303_t:CDS:1, partial [Paraglomus occultum]